MVLHYICRIPFNNCLINRFLAALPYIAALRQLC